MTNLITFEFCAEDRARLDRLADMFAQLKPYQSPETEEVNPPAVSEESEPAPEPRKYTASEIQLTVQRLASPATGKRDAVRQIVKEYADRVSEIPEAKFAEVMDRLTALEEG